MSNHHKNQRATNRGWEGISYFFADQIVEISLQDFLLSCDELTEKDFEYWKAVFDHMHLEERRELGRQSYKNVNLDSVLYENALKAPSAEEEYFENLEKAENETNTRSEQMIALQAIKTLKRKQKRRFLLYVVHQLSMREIAEIEGTSHVAIHLSIKSARNRIRKFLENIKKEQKAP